MEDKFSAGMTNFIHINMPPVVKDMVEQFLSLAVFGLPLYTPGLVLIFASNTPFDDGQLSDALQCASCSTDCSIRRRILNILMLHRVTYPRFCKMSLNKYTAAFSFK